jgi:hypothetical protein
MFTPGQYREKAVGYGELVKTANGPDERREFLAPEQRFTVIVDNEQWLADNHDKTVRSTGFEQTDGAALAQEEEQILRYLGAALILQWNTYRKNYAESSSTTRAPWANSWRRPNLEEKLLVSCTSTRMMTEQSHDHDYIAQE